MVVKEINIETEKRAWSGFVESDCVFLVTVIAGRHDGRLINSKALALRYSSEVKALIQQPDFSVEHLIELVGRLIREKSSLEGYSLMFALAVKRGKNNWLFASCGSVSVLTRGNGAWEYVHEPQTVEFLMNETGKPLNKEGLLGEIIATKMLNESSLIDDVKVTFRERDSFHGIALVGDVSIAKLLILSPIDIENGIEFKRFIMSNTNVVKGIVGAYCLLGF